MIKDFIYDDGAHIVPFLLSAVVIAGLYFIIRYELAKNTTHQVVKGLKDFIYDDGGRAAAGYKNPAGDCVCRAVAIASGRPYAEVRDRLRRGTGRVRHSKRRASPDNGIPMLKRWFLLLMDEFGFKFVAKGDLPDVGRLIVITKTHAFAVIDGVARDTHMRCLADRRFGYWIKQ